MSKLRASGVPVQMAYASKPARQLFQINFGICLETDTLFFHNVQAAVDDRFVQLEIGDSEAQQAAGIFTLFEYGDCISLPVQLVGSCQSCRARTDDGNLFAVPLVLSGCDISFSEGGLYDSRFVFAYCNRRVDSQFQHTRFFA